MELVLLWLLVQVYDNTYLQRRVAFPSNGEAVQCWLVRGPDPLAIQDRVELRIHTEVANDTYLDNVTIGVQCRVPVKLDDHMLDERRELARRAPVLRPIRELYPTGPHMSFFRDTEHKIPSAPQ